MTPVKIASVRKAFAWAGATLVLLAGLTPPSLAQGVATSSRQAQPRTALPPGMTPPGVEYRDIAKQAGLAGVNVSGSPSDKVYIVESTGNGVAIFDYNNDGLPDILFVNADRFNSSGPPARHYLYRNDGDLKFTDVTRQAGLPHTGWAQGVCAGDIDNDGHTDLFIPHWGQNRLFRNQGDGTFRDETNKYGFANNQPNTAEATTEGGKKPPRWSTGCAFLDYDRDGHLDLFVANYVAFDPKKTPKPGESAQCRWKGMPVLCGPRGLPGETMSLYRNKGEGGFTDVSENAGVAGPKNYYGFTPLTGDFDNDGWTDVYVSCDSTASLLYRNLGNGSFEELGVISGTAYNMDGMEQAGMGATAADFDSDGDLDIFKTNFSNDTHTLYRNDGDTLFMDETVSTGLAVNTQYLGWGTAFLDFDQDGWDDIFVANGHVYPSVDQANINESFKQQRLLYWNRGDGQFYDISAAAGPGILAKHSSRGIAIGDLDNDGSLEIVVVNMHEGPSLLKNFGEKANALLVRTLTADGRDAVGSRIHVSAGKRTQISETRSGGYHISQSDFRVHFGLGTEDKADIQIRWPDGSVTTHGAIAANHWVTIQQGKGVVKTQLLDTHKQTTKKPQANDRPPDKTVQASKGSSTSP